MSYLIYGAYGYTGTLIAERAVEVGHEPVLAGRNERRLRGLAGRLGLDARAVALDDPERLRSGLRDVDAVLHCAGPFSQTSAPMVEACLSTGTHYLDINGEIPVLRALQRRGADAEAEGIVLLPAVGFDVVPTDCLARALAEAMPSATTLEIAFRGEGGVSKGTLKTAVEQMGRGGAVRRAGRFATVPVGWTARTVEFLDGPAEVVSIPWGDVVTAGYSTDIPNITVYTPLPAPVRALLQLGRPLQRLLSWGPLQALLKRAIDRWGPSPSDAVRARGSTQVWVSVRDGEDTRRTARLRGPEAYVLTARTAVRAAGQVCENPPDPGYHTPATAFGASYVDEIEGVETDSLPSSS